MAETHKSLPLGSLHSEIGGGVRQTMNQIGKLYSMLEGDSA